MVEAGLSQKRPRPYYLPYQVMYSKYPTKQTFLDEYALGAESRLVESISRVSIRAMW
jgi:hypothetical protein